MPCVSTDLSFFYISFFNHASYHLLTTLFRKIGIGVKGVYRRRVGYTRQHGALVIAELIRSFAEIAHARLIYAIVTRTEINGVGVKFKDFFLIADVFNIPGDKYFREFTAQLSVLFKIHNTGELLSYGASSFSQLSGAYVVPYSSAYRHYVYAAVIPEPLILDCHHSLHISFRQTAERSV